MKKIVQIAKNTPRVKASAKKPLTISRLRCSMGKLMTVSNDYVYNDEYVTIHDVSLFYRERSFHAQDICIIFLKNSLKLWLTTCTWNNFSENKSKQKIDCNEFCAFQKNTGLFLGSKTGGIKSINCCWKPRKCYLHCLDFSYVKVFVKFSKISFSLMDLKKFNTFKIYIWNWQLYTFFSYNFFLNKLLLSALKIFYFLH